MKPKVYEILCECVEIGAITGVRRAFKHVEDPPDDQELQQIADQIENTVMNEITARFAFND
jgi:hypothetical protein